MTLIKSISGIRGTIGGPTGDTLNPLDIVKFTTAYAKFIRQSDPTGSNCIVVGRDARISGDMVRLVVCGTLIGMGYDVLDIGLATTPTTELAVRMSHAAGISARFCNRGRSAVRSSGRSPPSDAAPGILPPPAHFRNVAACAHAGSPDPGSACRRSWGTAWNQSRASAGPLPW